MLTVLELLQSSPGITGSELADRLETNVRTVRRYIAKLQDVGIPVEANPGRYGGYQLRPGYKLPPLVFSEEEAAAVLLGLLGSPWLAVEQSEAAVSGAISKITRVLPEEARRRVQALSSLVFLNHRPDGSTPNAALLIELSEALQSRRPVAITYSSERGSTERVVEPYGLVGRSGRWYLIAHCRLRTDYRTFRLDRIDTHETVDEHFVRDDSFDLERYVADNVEAYPGKWSYRVLFKTDQETLDHFFAPSAGRRTERGDGILFEGRTDSFDFEARLLTSYGIPFVALDPPELKEALKRLSERIIESIG